MSLYNMLFGENIHKKTLLEILEVDEFFFDRFRDISVVDGGKTIRVLTRLGGNNRYDYEDTWDSIRKHKLYVSDYDDDYDNTYAYVEFKVPEEYSKITTQLFEGEPKSIKEKFDEEIKEMDKPNSEASKRADIIANKIMTAIENRDSIIQF